MNSLVQYNITHWQENESGQMAETSQEDPVRKVMGVIFSLKPTFNQDVAVSEDA